MSVPRVTVKGQVTIPRAIRSAMNIEAGDAIVFMVEEDHVIMVPIKRRPLASLYGSVATKKASPGIVEERRIARQHLAHKVLRDDKPA